MMIRSLVLFALITSHHAAAFQGLPDGRYESPCMPAVTGSMLEAWVFDDGTRRFFQAISSYHDTACRDFAASDSWAGNYIIGEELPDPEGAWQIDLEFVRPEGRDPLFTLARINGSELVFGSLDQEFTGNSPAERPVTMDEEDIFRLQ